MDEDEWILFIIGFFKVVFGDSFLGIINIVEFEDREMF